MVRPPGDEEGVEPAIPDAGRVSFGHIKSTLFRVIRVDGAIGSVTPNGHIHMAVDSERPAIPRRLVQQLAEDGSLGDLIPSATVSRASVVREMDADIFMSREGVIVWRGACATDPRRSPSP
jgi:hypothetical protein